MSDPEAPAERPTPPLARLARDMGDVSPAWAELACAPEAAPGVPDQPALGRDRRLGLETIREGWLLHRGASRLAPGGSADLSLLVGDWCYAAGLCTIADHGSLDDVAVLADLVADVSARAAGSVDELAPRWSAAADQLAGP